MDIVDILDEIEAEIKASPFVPISGARAVNLETLQRLLPQLRAASRDGAQPVEEAEEQVVARAQNLAKLEVLAAHREAEKILDGQNIYAMAKRRSDDIVAAGRVQAQQVVRDAYRYAGERYQEGHRRLERMAKHLRDALKVTAEESRVQRARQIAELTPGGRSERGRGPSLAGRMALAVLGLAGRFSRRAP
jgi:hypothetical protein